MPTDRSSEARLRRRALAGRARGWVYALLAASATPQAGAGVGGPPAGPVFDQTASPAPVPRADYKATFERLEALARRDDGRAERLITLRTTPFFLAGDAASGAADGRLLPGSWVSVLERRGQIFRVRIQGWRSEGVASLVYARVGQRIVTAALGLAAQASVTRHDEVFDPGSAQTWHAVSLEGWVPREGLLADGEAFWLYAAELHSATCSVCHPLPSPDRFLANAWTGYLKAMRQNIALDAEEYRVLLKFLQLNALDTHPIDVKEKPVHDRE